ncbi:PREDICTED: N-acetyltransferase 9-like protein isoform X2 [Vollenhovia emeryi]|uniref:N-acetyltransferase 9-like protein isoform X2 n=1 Tax=Vollenhovia emeryi TaxID=411798 RepID=UPI0005F56262|nr:PREDICTED: N-acetyltransferase 9-like protein isoform X2 [Vollenhovia emeryi]
MEPGARNLIIIIPHKQSIFYMSMLGTQYLGLGLLGAVRAVNIKREHSYQRNERNFGTVRRKTRYKYLTSSEPLTLDEEFEMQKRWLEDEDKCTFIILDQPVYVATGNEIDAMVGDTNMFLHCSQGLIVAEIEIMIADESYRGKKRGWESIVLMLLYGVETLNINKFCAKIKLDNAVSFRMFEKLGFREVERSEVFHEVTLEKEASSDWISWLHSELQSIIPN